jgi:hypothetical protein
VIRVISHLVREIAKDRSSLAERDHRRVGRQRPHRDHHPDERLRVPLVDFIEATGSVEVTCKDPRLTAQCRHGRLGHRSKSLPIRTGGRDVDSGGNERPGGGFYEAHWAIHGKEVQSFWGRQAKEKYQDDHFFVTNAWASRVSDPNVVDNEVVRRVSDHGPVVFDPDAG